MLSELVSGSSGPDSSPDQGHWAGSSPLTVLVSTQVYELNAGGNPAMH